MKKTFGMYVACWVVLLALFNLITFITPNEILGKSKFGGAFWIGYAFITLAIIGHLVCAYIAFRQENSQKFFYHVPLITISYTATGVSVIVGTLFMAVPIIPAWIGAIVCAVVFAFNAIAVLKAKTAADMVDAIDKKIKEKTFFIKSLAVDAESLVERAESEEVKAKMKKVYDAVRYSDPMSNESLNGIEAEIAVRFAALSDAVAADDENMAKVVAEEVLILVSDRNKKCRLLK